MSAEAEQRAYILYVEDNPLVVKAIGAVLDTQGYIWKSVRTVEAALCELKIGCHLPDLILVDLVLPDRSGLDLVTILKSSPRTSWIPIFLITGYGMSGEDQKAMEAGCIAYFMKPVSTKALIKAMKDHIKE